MPPVTFVSRSLPTSSTLALQGGRCAPVPPCWGSATADPSAGPEPRASGGVDAPDSRDVGVDRQLVAEPGFQLGDLVGADVEVLEGADQAGHSLHQVRLDVAVDQEVATHPHAWLLIARPATVGSTTV